jgi:DNA mismatch repair protein MutS
MDEIGRGTSTFDGLSLAWATARHIATQIRAFTLFATHYFELVTLADEVDGVANVHLDATEHRDGIVFLHTVKPGPADRSYGLAVAQLAGLPREVVARAREFLALLESGSAARHGRGADPARRRQAELPLEPPQPEHAARDAATAALAAAVAAVDPDALSPRQALEQLYELKRLAAGLSPASVAPRQPPG